jgi:hypothetical protein
MPAIQWLATSSFVDHFFIPVNDELTCTRKILLEHSNDSHVEVLLATAIEISRYLQINQLKNMIRGLPILPVQLKCLI